MAEVPTPSVFTFEDPREFLNSLLAKKKAANPRFSMRAWAKQLGFANHNHLSMILSKKRKIQAQSATRIRKALNLGESEGRYFELLSLLHSARSEQERQVVTQALSALGSSVKTVVLKADVLQCFSNWKYIAVLELSRCQEFKKTPRWVAKKFAGEIAEAEAEEIIKCLERLKLLGQEGQRVTPHDVPNSSIRKVQLEFLDLAKVALEEHEPPEREFSSFTFRLKEKDLPKAKERIREFRKKFSAEFDSDEANQVFQLGIQLFNLTPNERSSQ